MWRLSSLLSACAASPGSPTMNLSSALAPPRSASRAVWSACVSVLPTFASPPMGACINCRAFRRAERVQPIVIRGSLPPSAIDDVKIGPPTPPEPQPILVGFSETTLRRSASRRSRSQTGVAHGSMKQMEQLVVRNRAACGTSIRPIPAAKRNRSCRRKESNSKTPPLALLSRFDGDAKFGRDALLRRFDGSE